MLTDSSAIHKIIMAANADPDCIGLIAWMHTFSPAKMWITGLDALQTPFLHLHTQAQRLAAVGRDRHGLHEPEPGRARRPRVRLHPDPARRGPHDGGRARVRPDHAGADRRLAAGSAAASPRSAASKLARFGDNMRNVAVTEGDKVEAELRFGVSVNTYGVNDLVEPGRRRHRRRGRRPAGAVRRRVRDRPRAPAGRRSARVAALRRQDRSAVCAPSSPTAGSARSPPTSRTSAGCDSCRVSPCSG